MLKKDINRTPIQLSAAPKLFCLYVFMQTYFSAPGSVCKWAMKMSPDRKRSSAHHLPASRGDDRAPRRAFSSVYSYNVCCASSLSHSLLSVSSTDMLTECLPTTLTTPILPLKVCVSLQAFTMKSGWYMEYIMGVSPLLLLHQLYIHVQFTQGMNRIDYTSFSNVFTNTNWTVCRIFLLSPPCQLLCCNSSCRSY